MVTALRRLKSITMRYCLSPLGFGFFWEYPYRAIVGALGGSNYSLAQELVDLVFHFPSHVRRVRVAF